MKKILYTLALLISFSSFGQDDIKQLIKTEGIINGETINVYKISENGEKEVYNTMEFKYNPKKHKKSLKRLLKKLNSLELFSK